MAGVIVSHARVRGACKGPALFGAVLLFLCPGPVTADVNVEVHAEGIAVQAEDTTLRHVLEALAEHQLVDVSASIPLDDAVSLSVAAEPLARLLRRLLRPYSYTLVEHEASSHRLPRLHVFTDSDPGAPVRWDAQPATDAGRVDRAIADLASHDADVREEAVLSLSDSGDPEVMTHFLATLSDPSPDVREAARAAIEDMETAELGERLVSPSPDRRD